MEHFLPADAELQRLEKATWKSSNGYDRYLPMYVS